LPWRNRRMVRTCFPRTKIVTDRFHVMRLIIHHFMEMARQIAPEIKSHRGLLGVLRKRKDHLNARNQEPLRPCGGSQKTMALPGASIA